jgi:hypothetical protein
MQNKRRQTDRIITLVIVAALAFNYPLLSLFESSALVLGIPVLYLYLFVAWAVLIGLMRAVMKNPHPKRRKRDLSQQRQ